MNRILLTGASGPIGKALLASFAREGVTTMRLVRGAQNQAELSWNPMLPVSPDVVSGFDAVIHLSGESVVGRWTGQKKEAIRSSRVLSTHNLAMALANCASKPRVFICASAIGFYGDHGDEIITEQSPSGQGFLCEVCREWENASRLVVNSGIRTVKIRIGLVLSKQGGALASMLRPFKLGLGGRLGSGRQWWSWIHVDDIVGAVHHSLRNESLDGPINLVGPNPAHNTEFTQILASVLHRPAIFPVPAFALELIFGEMAAREMLLSSQRVLPEKLLGSGYKFRYPELRSALKNLI
jgi:uncharacterized protein